MAESFRIARCENASDLEAFFTVRNRVLPLHAEGATYVDVALRGPRPFDDVRWVARVEDEIVGVGWHTSPEWLQVGVGVLPTFRHQGIGSALADVVLGSADQVSDDAQVLVDYEDARSVAFAQRYGCTMPQPSRAASYVLDVAHAVAQTTSSALRVLDPAELANPAFLETFTEVAGIANDPHPDLPPLTAGEAKAAEDSRLATGGVTILFEEDGELLGICQAAKAYALEQIYSEYTLVRRDCRGRGIGTEMKRAQIAWAKENGIERIVTDVPDSPAMHRILVSLGYRTWERTGMTRKARAEVF